MSALVGGTFATAPWSAFPQQKHVLGQSAVGVVWSKLGFLPISILFSWLCVICWRQSSAWWKVLDIRCSQTDKGKQAAELSHEYTRAYVDCVCALLHRAAAYRMYLLELVTAGSEVWTWTRRGLLCAADWCSNLQPAEDTGKHDMVALVCLRLCYFEYGLFINILDL